jgi:glycosyltransferase involved in cell wall biosynthesis
VERAAATAVDAVITTSEEDAATFRRWGARRVEVVPNGVDTGSVSFQPVSSGADIAYVGQFSYRPNEQAAIELIDEILPLVRAEVDDARVRLIGRNPSAALAARAAPDVDVIGPVDQVLPHLHRSRVLAVPLRAGSGTRLKILEAMAAGTPVVATPLGASGIDAEPGEELLIGETAEELAALITAVVTDDELAARLSARGRALVEARYDWSVLSPTLLSLQADLVATGARR